MYKGSSTFEKHVMLEIVYQKVYYLISKFLQAYNNQTVHFELINILKCNYFCNIISGGLL